MHTRFHITNTFALESRKLFVISGSVIEGKVQAGMFIRIPFNSQMSMTARIHSVEFARYPDREDVCLCVSYEDSTELNFWRELGIIGEIIDITPGGASD